VIDVGVLGKDRTIDNEPQARLLDGGAENAGELRCDAREVRRLVDGLHAPGLDA
jgi:hypothetical protein